MVIINLNIGCNHKPITGKIIIRTDRKITVSGIYYCFSDDSSAAEGLDDDDDCDEFDGCFFLKLILLRAS